MLGLPYDKPAAYTRDYLQVLNAAIGGPSAVPAGGSEATGVRMIDVENDSFTVHNPTVLGAATPMPVLVAALGPVMLQIAGEHADGTSLWMADEKAIGEHIAPPRSTRRPRRPVSLRPPHRRGYPGHLVRELRDRGGQGPRQPHPCRGRDVAELSEAAGPWRCPHGR